MAIDTPWYEQVDLDASNEEEKPATGGGSQWYEDPEIEESLNTISAMPAGPAPAQQQQDGSSAARFGMSALDAFNDAMFQPFRGAAWHLSAPLRGINEAVTGEAIEYSQFMPDKELPPPESRAEEIADVGGETFGTITAWIAPWSGLSRAYSATRSTTGFLSGTLPTPLLKASRKYGERLTASGEKINRTLGAETRRVAGQVGANLKQAVVNTPGMLARETVDRPLKSAFLETSTALGSSYGAMIMEMYNPGDSGARVAGEIAGGLFHPAALMARGATASSQGFKKALRAFSSDERLKARFAKTLTEAFEKSGDDPREVIRMLESVDVQDIPLTPGMKTGNEVLLGYESAIASSNPQYANERTNMISSAFKDLDDYLARALASDDPETVKRAADLAHASYVDRLEEGLMVAQNNAAEAIYKIRSARNPSEISREAYEEVVKPYHRGREVEAALWNKIDRNILPEDVGVAQGSVVPNGQEVEGFARVRFNAYENTLRSFVDVGKRLSRSEKDRLLGLKKDFEAVKKSVMGQDDYSSGDLINLRNKALREARRARGGDNPDRETASMYDAIAEGVRNDLEAWQIPGPEYARAREFSRAVNDVFINSAVGKYLGAGSGRRPEQMMSELFGGTGGLKARQNFDEMERAARFNPETEAFDATDLLEGSLGPQIRTLEHEFILSHANKFVNPTTGQINRNSLNKFMNDPENAAMLDSMPLLRKDLESAETAQEALEYVTKRNRAELKDLENSALGAFLGKAPPEKAVMAVLRNADYGEGIAEIAKMARSSGEAAVRGLGNTLVRLGQKHATDTKGNVSYSKLEQWLNSPVHGTQPSPYELIKQNQLMTERELDSLREYVTLGKQMEDRMSGSAQQAALSMDLDPLSELTMRIVGSRAATAVSNMGPGQSGAGNQIIIAGAGVRASKQIFQGMPLVKMQELAVQAVRDPKFMAEVLRTRITPENRGKLARQINLFMFNAGINSRKPDEERQFGEPWLPEEAALYEDVPRPWN